MPLIRRSAEADLEAILDIINEAAQAYRGVIPADRWHEPYMARPELEQEMAAGVVMWVAEEEGRIVGVMGIQDKGEVALVRHAYVARGTQRGGVGTKLLRHVQGLTDKPILIGTWAAASWAIDFYRRNVTRKIGLLLPVVLLLLVVPGLRPAQLGLAWPHGPLVGERFRFFVFLAGFTLVSGLWWRRMARRGEPVPRPSRLEIFMEISPKSVFTTIISRSRTDRAAL